MDALETQQWLVASRLPGDVGAEAYRQFVHVARCKSRRLSVRGALLFDGELAVHLIEGSAGQVNEFMGEVYAGQAHSDVRVLAVWPVPSPALPPCWQTGYAEPHALEPLCEGFARDEAAESSIRRFLLVMATVDCQ